jgi:hypothetical protein
LHYLRYLVRKIDKETLEISEHEKTKKKPGFKKKKTFINGISNPNADLKNIADLNTQ